MGGLDNYESALLSINSALSIQETCEASILKSHILHAIGGAKNYEASLAVLEKFGSDSECLDIPYIFPDVEEVITIGDDLTESEF